MMPAPTTIASAVPAMDADHITRAGRDARPPTASPREPASGSLGGPRHQLALQALHLLARPLELRGVPHLPDPRPRRESARTTPADLSGLSRDLPRAEHDDGSRTGARFPVKEPGDSNPLCPGTGSAPRRLR